MTIILFILAALVLIVLFLNHEMRRDRQEAESKADHWRDEFACAHRKWREAARTLKDTQAELDESQAKLADAELRIAAAAENLASTPAPTAAEDDDDMPF